MVKKKNKMISQIEPLVYEAFGQERGNRIMEGVWQEFNAFCIENSDDSKAVKRHTLGNYLSCHSFL